MNVIIPDIDKRLLNLLVSLYFGVDDRAWYYRHPGGRIEPGVLGDLRQSGLVDLVDSSQRGHLVLCKFGVTAVGEEVIKRVFLADPDRIIKASQSYLRWVPVGVTYVLRSVAGELRFDVSRLPELLVADALVISETASLLLSWLQEGQVAELVDATGSNLVGKP